jgi:regulation of enolase protein 1 (concanavalin A-like superfamily)
VLLAAGNLSSNSIQVDFSEPVEPASGTNAANYALNNGIAIASAAFGPSARIILLTTATPLTRGTSYTLTVNGVRDTSAARNLLAANSTHIFTALLKGLYRETYHDITGILLADLTNNPAFPAGPTTADLHPADFETTPYHLNNYGQRLRARLTAPVTGNYTFWLAAHHSATLFLGTNDQPASARVIAAVSPNALVSAREWDVQPAQRSALIPLIAGQQYYIEALSKSGLSSEYPPDHLAVRWQLPAPSALTEEPIPLARLTPYGLTLPLITTQPVSVVVAEGAAATFTVAVSNLDPINYQWQQNGTNLPGATNATYIESSVLLSENGSTFRCVLSNPVGATNTVTAILTVTPDVTRPVLTSVVNNSSNRVVVTFSETVDPATATNAANYTIPGITIHSVLLASGGRSVTLTNTAMVYGNTYTLTVNRVRDRAATYNVIATNTQATFIVRDFYLGDIGTAPPGTVNYASGGVDMTGGNGTFSDTIDAFNFAYQQRSGSFDIKVRVARLDFADTWTTAGLMVREDLSTNSRYAAVFATPSVAGTFFQSRTNPGVAPLQTGSFPVNYPYTWLRLERVSTSFRGYASYDGVIWSQLGSVTLPISSRAYVGFALTSRNPAQSALAQFRPLQSPHRRGHF